MTARPLLHVAAFWCDGDHGDPLADWLADRKIEGSRGAVVTFSPATADDPSFRATMARLDLSEVNDHPLHHPARASRTAMTS